MQYIEGHLEISGWASRHWHRHKQINFLFLSYDFFIKHLCPLHVNNLSCPWLSLQIYYFQVFIH